ncbi:unnamed protein product [Polarella glacialis]|uniref:Uncharacterized protein n=1 Tax=Polarella glacialis TaxID=89957 RepID=A0A813EKP3_POLGL|nr:unnamed protein product [Polarella glacialis]CAE8737192.1 unnamed protein product [Polarella glacialis]
MGLTVIVDASPNSVPPDLLSSRRQKVITVDNMPDALIMSEFPDLLESMEAIQLRHVVLAVVGGVPATAVSLNADVQSASIPEQVEVAVYKFVQEELFIAIKECSEAVRHRPKMQEIFDQFRGSSEVDCDILGTCGVELQSPDKILRVVRGQEGKPVLVPATPAIKIVLHHGLAKVPALEELRALIPQ